MRASKIAAVVFAGLIAAPLSQAADISPGLREISVESRVSESPGFTPPTSRMTKCFTAQDARDPSKMLGDVANTGATGCTYTERNYSGSTLTFAMQCAGDFAMVSRGTISFAADTMQGNITAKANVAGQNVEMQNKISARRVGGC